MKEEMTFNEAVKILKIEDYATRIYNSNSKGELSHLFQYILMAKKLKKPEIWFREWFENIVTEAEEEWERPESVFQHVTKILMEAAKGAK